MALVRAPLRSPTRLSSDRRSSPWGYGASLVADYRAMEQDARDALAQRLAKLERALAEEAVEEVAEPR